MLRLVAPLVAGVVAMAFLLGEEGIELSYVVGGLLGGLVVTVVVSVFANYKRKPYLFGLFLSPILFILGGLLTLSVSNYVFPDTLISSNSNVPKSYLAVVVDQPQIKERSVALVAELADLEGGTNGTALLYFHKDSSSIGLKYGQEIVIRTQLQVVEGMGNPNEFNYARYLRFHGITNRGYVKENGWKLLSNGNPGITGWLLDLRSILIAKFEEAGLSGNELSVASALVLGYRTDLDKELMVAYAGAGATHVLAVSGLHVGIVYVILNWLLRFLDRRKVLRVLKTMLLVFLLFGYAGLTGLSASVFRAATMFSFVAIGRAINRSTNIFNTLAASAFCLILYEPMIIMQVGFQLSYLAVIGIVVIQPRLVKLTYSKYRLVDWAWSITCVSIAAQIATFPLGLLYFHQFPNLFLVSNLLVIPAAGLILYLGFALFLASIWKPILLVFGFLLEKVIFILNQVVVWIEQIPYSVLSGIDISTFEALIIYAVIVGVLVFIIHKQRFALYTSLSLSIIFLILQVIEVNDQKKQQFIAVYNVKKQTVVALVNGTELTVIASKDFWLDEQAKLFHVQHHWWKLGIETENFLELNDSLMNRRMEWGGKSFAILNLNKKENPTIQLDATHKLDMVIVSALDWSGCSLIDELSTDQIIIPNNFGEKMKQRMQDLTPEKTLTFVSETGMVQF